MRTQDPGNIRADFDASINDIQTAFNASESGVAADEAKKLIAEYLFVAAATLFEGYLSDLFVACINRNSKAFRDHILARMDIQTTDEYAKRAAQDVKKSLPHLSVDKIRQILEPTGYNITFPTTDKMKEAAGKWLVPAYKTNFTGASAEQCATIDFIKAVRNFLAHRSQRAKTALRAALRTPDLPTELRRTNNSVVDVGTYLRATQTSERRFILCLAQILAISAQFCP